MPKYQRLRESQHPPDRLQLIIEKIYSKLLVINLDTFF